MTHILLIEDDPSLRQILSDGLLRESYKVTEAIDVKQTKAVLASALAQQATNQKPDIDIILLDLNLPDGTGESLLSYIRRSFRIPVLIISARHEEGKKIQMLDEGADDYLVKPFSVAELLARIRVAIRHSNLHSQSAGRVYKNGDLIFDLDKKRVTLTGQVVKLSKTELKLLTQLAISPGYICTHRQLLKEVWGSEFVEHTHYLRIYMAQIRAKIEHNPADPQILLTETGIGYRLAEA
jgi:two-component system, OmpR family, KDP operon response regulator KdpE